jgi:protocatechuate 3,4-dioxygenase beta subunit
MKPSHACLLLTLLVSQAVLSQTAASTSTPRATVAGMVTKDPSGEPVKKALIELIAENQTEGGNYTAITAADGAFQIDGIVPGRYRLFVERTGYLEVDKHRPRAEGRLLTLTAGQEIKDLLIRLQAAAVVEGRVTDEDGDPLPGAEVDVMRQTFTAGRSRWEQVSGERTNDLGEYRIAGLAAGAYYISVTPPTDFKSLIESTSNASASGASNQECPARAAEVGGQECPTHKPAATSYMTTYYPATKDRSQAAAVQLHAGDDFPANFSLTRSPSLTIRGSVANLPPGASAVVMLQSRDFNLTLNGAEIHKDGSFEIRDVSPGAYTVVASVSESADPMIARQSLQVSSENVEGLRLAPHAGAWVHGRIRVESKGLGRLDPSQLFLTLHSADGDDDMAGGVNIGEGFSSLAHVSSDGSFEWKSVPAGHYYVQLAGDGGSPDFFLKSALSGGRDACDVGFTVNGGAAVLDLVASANGAVIDGVATNAKGELMANATVVLVPEERLRSHTDRYRKTVSDQSGRFALHGIPPGAYTLLAWENVDGEAYYNPEFLKSCEGQGRAQHLVEGERKSVQLQAIPASDDQP